MTHDPKLVEAVARHIEDEFGCAADWKASDILDTLAAMGALVPQGWQAVPVEATDVMIGATHAADATYGAPLPAEQVWSTMLAAAPKPGDV